MSRPFLSRHLRFLLLSLSLLLTACECEDLVPSERFEVPNTLIVIPDGAGGELDKDTFFASFEFTAPLDAKTVELDNTVFVEGSVAGEIGLFLGNNGQRLFLSIPVGGCLGNSCGKSLTFRLRGTGEVPIRDLDGRILDGDYDNSDGGDYVLTQSF